MTYEVDVAPSGITGTPRVLTMFSRPLKDYKAAKKVQKLEQSELQVEQGDDILL